MSSTLLSALSVVLLAAASSCWTNPMPQAAGTSTNADVPADAIDRLFARWDSPNSPGFVVGVVRNGRLAFARGYGMANLEYGVPLTPRSPFYIASMSKQFTAACAALLVQQGRLRLDDPVRRYVPELRASGTVGRPPTVRHLIHHTGGVREWSSLSIFAGQDDRFEHRIDNSDVLRMLARQENLEFTPGSRYRYSSGGYQILTAIIERVSGRSLPQFAREQIFEPLGMTETLVEDNYAAILPGRVESYRPLGNGRYERILKHFDVYGDGGMITTLEDLVRWDQALRSDRVGQPGLAETLLTRARLETGAELTSAFGLNVYEYKGHRIIEHGGGMLGFTVDMMRFPDDDFTVIALANTPEVSSTTMAFQVADLLLDDESSPGVEAPTSLPLPAAELARYAGYYWSAERNFYRRLDVRDGRLVLDAGDGTMASVLVPVNKHVFVLADRPTVRVVFGSVDSPSARLRVGVPETGDGFEAERFDPAPPKSLQELRPFLGTYYSAELAATYRFWEHGDQVFFQIGDGRPAAVFPRPSGRMLWNAKAMLWTGFGEIIFRRDDDGQVNGLTIGDRRVSRIFFDKVE